MGLKPRIKMYVAHSRDVVECFVPAPIVRAGFGELKCPRLLVDGGNSVRVVQGDGVDANYEYECVCCELFVPAPSLPTVTCPRRVFLQGNSAVRSSRLQQDDSRQGRRHCCWVHVCLPLRSVAG